MNSKTPESQTTCDHIIVEESERDGCMKCGAFADPPWKRMREKATGRVSDMRYIEDACDGGAWEIKGEVSMAHPDTIYHGWEEANV